MAMENVADMSESEGIFLFHRAAYTISSFSDIFHVFWNNAAQASHLNFYSSHVSIHRPVFSSQRYATLILQNLAADSKMVTTLLRAGMVSPLLNLLSNLNASSLPDASLHTLAVLRCLSVDDLVKPRMLFQHSISFFCILSCFLIFILIYFSPDSIFRSLSHQLFMNEPLSFSGYFLIVII